MKAWAVSPGRPLRGAVRVPGDKSIAQRCLVLAALAEGVSVFRDIPESGDVQATRTALKRLGVAIRSHGRETRVQGRGLKGLLRPASALDARGSGTTARLLMGLLAGQPFKARITGDAFLRRRPMGRVAKPLSRMGARIRLSAADRLPLSIEGGALEGIAFASPAPSAQLKSAVLIAGLQAQGRTSVREPLLSRDHTERLLPLFGARTRRVGPAFEVDGGQSLRAVEFELSGDPSSAAFWVVAATLLPGSRLRLPGVGANPTRTGFLRVLRRMGARIETSSPQEGIEPSFDLLVRPAGLSAAEVRPEDIPGLIDEIPVLALAATQAQGTSRFRGVGELRLKESDRLSGLARLLSRLGARARAEGDDLVVSGPCRLLGARVDSLGDHRLAMTALVAGLLAEGQTLVQGARCVDASYPGFFRELERLRG